MSDSVVLLGVTENGSIGAVGLYADMEAARVAAQSGTLPEGDYPGLDSPIIK